MKGDFFGVGVVGIGVVFVGGRGGGGDGDFGGCGSGGLGWVDTGVLQDPYFVSITKSII